MSAHPDSKLLVELLRGRLPEAQSREIKQHLQACNPCRERWQAIRKEMIARIEASRTLAGTSAPAASTIAPNTNAPNSNAPSEPPPTILAANASTVKNESAEMAQTEIHQSPTSEPIAATEYHPAKADSLPPTQFQNTPVKVDSATASTYAGNQALEATSPPTMPHTGSSSNDRASSPGSSDTQDVKQLGPYLIEAKLGEGGMGAVYRARHTKLDKLVALKVLPAQFTHNKHLIARFEREMKAVGKLDHPQIVRALDAGEINGVHYLAMEYIEGTDLHGLVSARGQLTVVNACKAMRQAAQALAAAHAVGLVHRDIKPANLFLAKSGQLKVLDLGLALLGEEANQNTELTTAGQTFGTPDYMAPEQWENAHSSDGRVDLYALGCTLHFLLTGRAPYATDRYRSSFAKMKAHATAPIPSLRESRPDVPQELDELYLRLMAKDPKERLATANELVAELLPFTSTKYKSGTAGDQQSAANSQEPIDPASPSSDALTNINVPSSSESRAPDSLVIRTSAFSKSSLTVDKGEQKRKPKLTKNVGIAVGVSAAGLLLVGLVIGGLASGRSDKGKIQTAATLPATSPADSTRQTPQFVQPQLMQPEMDPGAANATASNDLSTNAPLEPVPAQPAASPPTPSTDDTLLGPIDYAAERKAAEWALSKGANIMVGQVDSVGVSIAPNGTLPSTPFYLMFASFHNVPITDEDLAQLSACRRLNNLTLDGNRISGTGLRHLSNVRSLEILYLAWQRDSSGEPILLNDSALASLSSLTRLSNLDLVGNMGLTDACCEHIANCPELRVLSLRDLKIGDAGIQKLTALKKLANVNLGGLKISEVRMQELVQSLPMLDTLDMLGGKATAGILATSTELKVLRIPADNLRNANIPALRNLSKLEEFVLVNCRDFTVPQIMHLPQLRRLSLTNYNVDKSDLLARHRVSKS